MRKILTACALSAIALGASAQGAAQPHAQAAHTAPPAGWIQTASVANAETPLAPAPRAELLNVAVHGSPGMQAAGPVVVQRKQDPAPEQEHRHRAGPAMLLAALAVMSAIALRRLVAADQ